MNYVDRARLELSKHIKVGKGLMRVYTVLVLVKGEETTLADVHDAWAVSVDETWDREKFGDHRSVVPFDELDPETQAKDQRYVDAIRAAARALRTPAR